jgi:hypothetical protein
MKRFVFTFFLITVFVFGVFCQDTSLQNAFLQNGVIRELTGEVDLKPAGTDTFARASAGDTVNLNAIVSTGFRSTVVIEVGNSLITVRPLTRLSLAEIQRIDNTENVNLNLQTGRIRVDVNPPAGSRANFTVSSPVATASVRGTSFEFDTVNLTVDEGIVIFSGNTSSAVVVAAGASSFVGIDGVSANPAEVITASLLPPAPVGTPSHDILPQTPDNTLVNVDWEIRF